MAREYAILVHRDPDSGRYLVDIPDLPDVFVEGITQNEARRLAQEAVAFHLECLAEEGLPIPEPRYSAHAVSVA